MAAHSYPIEVESDFLEKITRAKPIQAVAEFVWNGLDADATIVDVRIEQNAIGTMSQIVVQDNGTGMAFVDAPELFKKLGGSWKRAGATTKRGGRFLHGQDGRGRFKAFSLGRVAEWDVTYQKEKSLSTFKVVMTAGNMKEVIISDEEEAPSGKQRDVTVRISELHKDYRSLTSDAGLQEFTEIFALYLADYKDVSIVLDSTKVDPAKAIASREVLNLNDIIDEGKAYPVRLEIIGKTGSARLVPSWGGAD